MSFLDLLEKQAGARPLLETGVPNRPELHLLSLLPDV
jgi:hypothetical protein